MFRFARSLATAVAVAGFLSASVVGAQQRTAVSLPDNEVYAATTRLPLVNVSDCGCEDSCTLEEECCDCCCPGGVYVLAEAVFLKYGRADGVRVGVANGEQANSQYEVTPRLTLGWMSQSGLGARVRYWEFDHAFAAVEGGASGVSVDTYTFDAELYENFALNDVWALEIAGGVRYNDFNERLQDDGDIRINDFHGFGGVMSAEFIRQIGRRSSLFVRGRAALLMDDKRVFNNDSVPIQDVTLNDVTVGMTELALGYEYSVPLRSGSLFFLRAQAEWQNWSNFTSSFPDQNNSERFAGPSDVSFVGFGAALGFVR